MTTFRKVTNTIKNLEFPAMVAVRVIVGSDNYTVGKSATRQCSLSLLALDDGVELYKHLCLEYKANQLTNLTDFLIDYAIYFIVCFFLNE